MSERIRLGIAGATATAIEPLLALLDDVVWRPEITLFAPPTDAVGRLTYGEDELAVDDVADLDPGALDALVVMLPPDVAAPVVDRAAAAGLPVVDHSGSRLADLGTPVVVPWVDDRGLTEPAAHDVVTVPGPAALLLASVLGPLGRRAPLTGVEATVLLPASAWGPAGVEELSRQVVSLFNSQPPPRRVFEHGLAFDLMPLVGTVRPSGWSDRELLTSAEVARAAGVRVDVTAVAVPVFTGVSATLRLQGDDALDPDTVARLLSSHEVAVEPSVDGRTIPRPRRVEGRAEAQVSRIRTTGDGGAIHLWAAQDDAQAAAEALGRCVEGLLRRRGLLGEAD